MLRVLRSIPAKQLRLLVFDLDGTLIDSRKDLAESVNAMLVHCGLSRQPESQIASFIGNGAAVLVERSLAAAAAAQGAAAQAADPALTGPALEYFLDYYREHKLDYTRLYPGVHAALTALQSALPVQMAVLTNKPVVPSRQICTALGLDPFFCNIYGGNSFATRKPDPEGLQTLMREAGARPDQTLMVGDTDVDIRTAQAAGAFSLGCRFGLSPHTIAAMEQQGLVDAVVDSAAEWCDALGLLPQPDASLHAEVSHGL